MHIKQNFWIWLVATFLIILIWAAWTFFAFQGASMDIPIRGQIGDSYGALNTLFTGLAFSAVVAAAFYERANLAVALKAAEDQEKEMKAIKADRKVESFERTLFLMLESHRQIIESLTHRPTRISIESKGTTFKGREVVKLISDNLSDTFNKPGADKDENNWIAFYKAFVFEFDLIRDSVVNLFDHILENAPIEKRERYIRIARGQISKAELGICFYLGLLNHNKALKEIAEKVCLFEEFNASAIEPGLKAVYLNTAFDIAALRKQNDSDR